MTASKEAQARDEQAMDWLLASDEPGIRLQARRDLLGEEVTLDYEQVTSGPIVTRLLRGQRPDGGFGTHPYQKWMGAHWRLVSLVELGMSASDGRVMRALEMVLGWLAAEDGDPRKALQIRGRYRVHGSIYANALAVACKLGTSSETRARNLAESLMFWQWPDGGWNCDRHPGVTHSSFYESITPLWALSEYARATGDVRAKQAARRAAEFFLDHRVFQSHRTAAVGDPKWLKLRYPEYWHYDYVHGLLMLSRAGALSDRRTGAAIQLLRSQQRANGRWEMSGSYWRGTKGLYGDAAGWTRDTAGQMLTLNALRVLKAAGG